MCVRVCVCVSVCACVCVCVSVSVCPPELHGEAEVGNYQQGAGALFGGLLPMKTSPGRAANVPAVVHLDGSVCSWWPD